ncbi:hypothetical protein [Streptomyces halobius]|uniref:Uncharacterized protein n=1 Tax=Streptomyces halobius TaxID=2879846 RepID=A0ABY4M5K1_9ACTN|nr:hypothetical protein [Streptomyces halobius]UQA93042.1 hypothetical protein K9S39_15415 [Streptomyces halobius]
MPGEPLGSSFRGHLNGREGNSRHAPASTRIRCKAISGRCAAAFGPVFILVWICLFVIKGLTAAGVIGTHGILTVDHCIAERSRKNDNPSAPPLDFTCDGTFRSDDGKIVDDAASVSGPETDQHAGADLPVNGNNDNVVLSALSFSSYALASRWEITKNFMIPFAILLIVP